MNQNYESNMNHKKNNGNESNDITKSNSSLNIREYVAKSFRSVCGNFSKLTLTALAIMIATSTTVYAGGLGGGQQFFQTAIDNLSTIVIAIGAGLGVWGIVNLIEGYGNDNPGSKSQGMKQFLAGAGLALLGVAVVPQLMTLFT